MRQVNINSSIDASPTYSGSRQQQFASGLARPKMAGSTRHAKAFGNALAGANQAAAGQRMAASNLKTSLAGQKARSDDQNVLAGLYAADVADQVKRRSGARQLAQAQQENNAARLAGMLGLMGSTSRLLGGLLTRDQKIEDDIQKQFRSNGGRRGLVDGGSSNDDDIQQMMLDAQFM